MQQAGYAVIDVETTGFTNADRIVEIGVVLTDAEGTERSRWGTLVQPGRDIPNSSVHGITASDVVSAPSFAGVAFELASLIDGHTVVAHNASFDVHILSNEFERLGVELPEASGWSLCTMRWSAQVLPGSPKKLSECAARFGIVNERAHSAEGDAVVTAQLLSKLLQGSENNATLHFEPEQLAMLAALPKQQPLPRGRHSSEAVGSWVRRLVRDTPRSDDESLARYRDLLAAALLDKELSATETKQLAECAAHEGITHEDAVEIHREFLGQIAVEAWADGVVTDEEEVTLRLIGAQLGVPTEDVDKLLAQPATGPAMNFTLTGGQRVSFTGSMELGRTTWEQRARQAGLEVGAVTKKTVLLVAANPDSMSSKARRARELHIPIVNESTFALLLGNLARSVDPEPQQETPDIAAVFPWFDLDAAGPVTEATIAAQWRENHKSDTLAKLSPYLSSQLPDSLGITPRAKNTWLSRHPAPFEATLLDLFDLRGFGKVTANKVLTDLLVEALDSHQSQVTVEVEEYTFDIYEEDADQDHDEAARAWDAVAVWLGEQLAQAPEAIRQVAGVLDALDPRATGELTAVEAVRAVETAVGDDVRDQAIFLGRTFDGLTLEQLGQQFDVTRERIRQIELDITTRVGSCSQLDVLAAVLTSRVSTAVRRADLLEALPSFAAPGPFCRGDLLEFVVPRTRLLLDDHWLETPEFAGDLAAALESEYGVASLRDTATTLGVEPDVLRAYIEGRNPEYIWVDEDTFLSKVGSHQDRACGLLAHAGQPLSLNDICARLGHGNARSMANQLSIDPRVMRARKDEWALSDWGLDEYVSISDWITKKIEQGPTTLQDLLEEAETIGVSQNSVRSYATGAQFVLRDGYLALATEEDLSEDKPACPEYAKHLYQLADGYGYVFTVTREHLRGSGSMVPVDLTRLLKIPALGSITLSHPEFGEIAISRRQLATTMGSIRNAVQALGLKEGERAILVTTETTFDLRRASEADEQLTGLAGVLNQLGIDGEYPETEPLEALSTALFLGADAPRRKIVRALRERKLDELADVVANG